MIKRPSGLSRHYTDTTLHQYECGEYSALAAWWITNQGLNDDHPVYIVTLITKHWSHTVCEVKGKGTFDGKNNLFLPENLIIYIEEFVYMNQNKTPRILHLKGVKYPQIIPIQLLISLN